VSRRRAAADRELTAEVALADFRKRTECGASERVTELEQILVSVHVVDPPDAPSNSVTFGATVTMKDKKGAAETLTIVGVDELDLERDAVSWISPLGKALPAADMGDWIKLDDGRSAKIVKIEFKTGQM
jgi:transcription elongation factor GreB